MTAGRVLLLMGVPGIGKTTVIRRVAARLKGRRLGGFYTEEIRENGVRRGFRLVEFDGTARVIAHVDFPKVHRVGKYGVDVEAIDLAADRLGLDPADIYLTDEIEQDGVPVGPVCWWDAGPSCRTAAGHRDRIPARQRLYRGGQTTGRRHHVGS